MCISFFLNKDVSIYKYHGVELQMIFSTVAVRQLQKVFSWVRVLLVDRRRHSDDEDCVAEYCFNHSPCPHSSDVEQHSCLKSLSDLKNAPEEHCYFFQLSSLFSCHLRRSYRQIVVGSEALVLRLGCYFYFFIYLSSSSFPSYFKVDGESVGLGGGCVVWTRFKTGAQYVPQPADKLCYLH